MSNVPCVFISAVSRELGSYRKAVTDVLLKLQAFPVVQDHFPPDTRTVADMLRDKIRGCDAVIALVGRCYGFEPSERDSDRPRRSYTQLEYEIALELEKPVFTFLTTDDCPRDPHDAEPDELHRLQLDHVERIAGGDRIWIPFRSLADLTDGVRLIRFDADSLKQEISTEVACLLVAELTDPAGSREHQGEPGWIREVVQPFQEILRSVIDRSGGRLQAESPSGYELNYKSADAAVAAALDLHHAVRAHPWPVQPPALRVGIHLGQVVRFGGLDDSRVLHFGRAMDLCRRICLMSLPGQTLLTRTAFDVAREQRGQAPGTSDAEVDDLRWLSHGRFELAGFDEAVDVYEVGEERAPLKAPPDAPGARRADSLEQQRMQGWRPAPGQEVPRRPGWVIDRKLGEGGFGEVWVARHARTKEPRVFKFCFDADRLGSFKRELTLFRLLRDALGDRPDIAKLLEVELDEVPYYLESEFVPGGNLRDWAITDGRLAAMSLDDRLRVAAEIAAAAAAAHSVGIIHKDLKPSNVFMRQDDKGVWHPMLADFGIGAVADPAELKRRNITVAGFTRSLLEPGSSRTGTRMYQPPEASLGKVASVQGDVYALGVLLFQAVIGDFDQPLGIGWDRRLDASRRHVWPGGPDPSIEDRIALLHDDIASAVDGDPATRLSSAAQLDDLLRSLPKRIADRQALRRAEQSATRLRHLRRALAATAAGLIVVGGLGAFSYAQWRRAEENARKAGKNETRAIAGEQLANNNAEAARQQSRLTLETLSAVIFDIQRSLENLPASSPIRRRLLDTALTRLENLSGAFVDRSTADRQTADVLMTMADLILQFGEADRLQDSRAGGKAAKSARDGASMTALKLNSRAREILETLAKVEYIDGAVIRDLALTYDRLGDLQFRLGESASALSFFTKSFKLREALASDFPEHANVKRDLTLSYDRLGDAQLRLSHTTDAMTWYAKSFQLREALASADPKDAQAKRDLSSSCGNLGDVRLQLGDAAGAIAFYTRSVQLHQSLTIADPSNAQAKRGLLVAYNKLGGVQLQLGDTSGALASYTRSFQLGKTLADADPHDVQAKRDLATCCTNLGDVQLQLGDTASALASHTESFQLNESLANADPKNAQAKRDLCVSYDRIGEMQLRLGDTAKAMASFTKLLQLCESLVRVDPTDTLAKRGLSVSYDKLGKLQLRLGDTAGALVSCTKEREIDESLASADPKDAQAKRALAVSYNNLGNVQRELGDTAKAMESYSRLLQLMEALANADPKDARAKRDLSVANDRLGDVQLKLGDDASAMASYTRSFRLNESLADADPKNAEARRGLSYSHMKFGHAYSQQGHPVKAGQSFTEAINRLENLLKSDPRNDVISRMLGETYNNLAWLLATCWDDSVRNGSRAVELAMKHRELTGGKDPGNLDTLAAACAEAGRFEEALSWQKKALLLAKDDPAFVAEANPRLKLYEARKPYHETRPDPRTATTSPPSRH